MEAAGGTKEDSNLPSYLATIRPIRTYVRLVRTNRDAGPSGGRSMYMPSSERQYGVNSKRPLAANIGHSTART
jgi:hypothetical protein